MAKQDQDEIRKAIQEARREPLPSYTDEDEQSVVKHVQALRRHEVKGGSSADLVVATLHRTLDGLPKQDRIWFLLALTVLGALALAGFVVLKVKGVW